MGNAAFTARIALRHDEDVSHSFYSYILFAMFFFCSLVLSVEATGALQLNPSSLISQIRFHR